MLQPTKEIIEKLRSDFPIGTRISLVYMDDKQAPPVGTKGTVKGVDDIGSVMVEWDNGSSLNVVYGVDKIRKIDQCVVVCYGKTKVFESRHEAQIFYIECASHSEGSERERYLKILHDLTIGKSVCRDEK